MRLVSGRLRRQIAALLSTLSVLGLVVLPAEHVHVAADRDHHANVIHRHFEALRRPGTARTGAMRFA